MARAQLAFIQDAPAIIPALLSAAWIVMANSKIATTRFELRRRLSMEEYMKKISDVMTRDVQVANPDDTIQKAATMMAKADVGSLPVGENDRLVGMVTDRDIVLRAVAEGRDLKTSVRDVMTAHIHYCFDDEDVTAVAENMAGLKVRRLAVLSRDKRLVGIVALSNVTNSGEAKASSELLKGVAEPHHK